ncbi:MAG: SUF system NifU family Fe-S cluster assembly protein [Burkholderiales bacterium]|jgi:nitrogen fixation NifU-like protein|nr:SUF system NifU family Fe-S cluster assembly protein [Burkholderiales bacterium]
MADLRELYQEVIFDHYKRPRNFHRLSGADCFAEGHNPLCGDRITVYLKTNDGVIEDVSFEGSGCAISTASASLMTEVLKGKTLADVERLFEGFHAMVTDGDGSPHADLGKLEVLSGVREFPARVKCATLAWHTLNAALRHQASVTTE